MENLKNVVEITEELMDQLFENERGFDPMYDIEYGDSYNEEEYI